MTELFLSSFGFFCLGPSIGGVGSLKDLVSSKSSELIETVGTWLSETEMKDLRLSVGGCAELELESIRLPI